MLCNSACRALLPSVSRRYPVETTGLAILPPQIAPMCQVEREGLWMDSKVAAPLAKVTALFSLHLPLLSLFPNQSLLGNSDCTGRCRQVPKSVGDPGPNLPVQISHLATDLANGLVPIFSFQPAWLRGTQEGLGRKRGW
jgi:hypothetical protein